MDILKIESTIKKTHPTFIVETGLIQAAEADYITARSLLFLCGGGTLWKKIIQNSAECLEKILKAYLINKKSITTKDLKKLNHDLEKIRKECEKIDQLLSDAELIIFCENFSNGIGHEVFKYGFQETTGSHGGNLDKIINLLDNIFLNIIIKIDNTPFTASNTLIANLFHENDLGKMAMTLHTQDQINNLKYAIETNNQYLNNFIETIKEFWKK